MSRTQNSQKHKGNNNFPQPKRHRSSAENASISLINHYRDEIQKSQSYAAHTSCPPTTHALHPRRSFTASVHFADPKSILSSANSIDHELLRQAAPSHYDHIQHTSIQSTSSGIILTAHFTSASTFLAAIHDPTSPYFRSSLPLHQGGWLPSEHVEKILLINVPGPHDDPDMVAQQLYQHISSATGHTPIQIQFPKGTDSPRFPATLELSTPVTPTILQQIYSLPYENTNLLSGGTADPNHHRCSCCHSLGHSHHQCPHKQKLSVTLHTNVPLFPYHIPEICACFDCEVIPGTPEHPLPSDQSFRVLTLTFSSPQSFLANLSPDLNKMKFFDHHRLTKFYHYQPHHLCSTCYTPTHAPSHTCPHHPNPTKSTPPKQTKNHSSPKVTSKSQSPRNRPQRPPSPSSKNHNRFAVLAQAPELRSPPIHDQRRRKKIPKPHKRSRSRSPKQRHKTPKRRSTKHRTSPRRDKYKTPSSSPRGPRSSRRRRLHDSFSTMKLRPSHSEQTKRDSAPTQTSQLKPNPHSQQINSIPESHLLTPCDPELARSLTVIPNAIPSELEQTLLNLAEDPSPPYKRQGKAHDLKLYAKSTSGQPLEYTWSSGSHRIQSAEWHPTVNDTLDHISSHLPQAANFNSCLLNRFKTGKDYTPEHSDKHQESNNPDSVALLSVGTPREFHFRNKRTKQVTKLTLHPRTLLYLSPECNQTHKHLRPKAPTITSASYSFTFRSIPDKHPHD